MRKKKSFNIILKLKTKEKFTPEEIEYILKDLLIENFQKGRIEAK